MQWNDGVRVECCRALQQRGMDMRRTDDLGGLGCVYKLDASDGAMLGFGSMVLAFVSLCRKSDVD